MCSRWLCDGCVCVSVSVCVCNSLESVWASEWAAGGFVMGECVCVCGTVWSVFGE